MSREASTSTQALATALDAEHAAIYAYGPIGVRLDSASAADARQAEAAHRARRDALVLRLTALGASPPPPAPSYTLPYPVKDRAAALKLATEIEERAAAVWRAALPETVETDRATALAALTDCAVRATRWRRRGGVSPAIVPFPGRVG